MDKKRIIMIVIFTLICLGLGFLLYKVFFAKDKLTIKPKTKTPQITSSTTLPVAEEGGPTPTKETPGLPESGVITKADYSPASTQIPSQTYSVESVSDSSVIGMQTDQNGTPRFYNQIDGRFYSVGANGEMVSLSDQTFYNVQNVTWSPVTNASIIEYPDGSNIYYNFETKKQVTLPKHWQSFTFSPTGDKIASESIGLSPENRWLITADPEGKNIKLIEPLGENANKVIVDWSPNQQTVALSRTGEALGSDREEILFVGLNKENFKSITAEGRGFQSQWSPTGKQLLYSVHSARSNYKPELWLVNSEGDNIGTGRKLLNINTWAEKCTFADERTVYCAIPTTMPVGAGFAPDLTKDIPDAIYKIDIETGIKSEIKLEYNYPISKLSVGDNGEKLYFTDKNTNLLFSLPL